MSDLNETTLFLSAGPLRAAILPFGATLARLRFHGRDMLLGFEDMNEYRETGLYAGCLVGPVANRVQNGQIVIDGQRHQMPLNEGGETCLHSGAEGLHAMEWQLEAQSEAQVSLRCHLPHGHGGLPGNRDISACYKLDASGLTLEITARSDAKTPMNIAHHPYWALEAEQSCTRLWINAERYLPVDHKNIPTGVQAPVHNTPFDFRTLRPLGPKAQLDHNWCLNDARSPHPRHRARLQASDGLTLDISTTECGLQAYSGSGLPTLPPQRCNGLQIKPHAGIALEPQAWPDAPNHPDFPSIILQPDKLYHQITRYRIT